VLPQANLRAVQLVCANPLRQVLEQGCQSRLARLNRPDNSLKAAHTDFEIAKTLFTVKLSTAPTDLNWKLMTCNVQQLM
jgi:hypothetical protein